MKGSLSEGIDYRVDNLIWPHNTPVVIWGCGEIGEKAYQRIRNVFEIVAFCDSFKVGVYCGLPIISPDDIPRHVKVVVAVGKRNIDEIMRLCLVSRRFFYDVIPYSLVWLDKIELELIYEYAEANVRHTILRSICNQRKVVCIVGNCQIDPLVDFMNSSATYRNNYVTFLFPAVHLIKSENMVYEMVADMSMLIDILITQIISVNNRHFAFYETSNMIEHLSRYKKISVVRIPILFFDGYFVQGGIRPNKHSGFNPHDPKNGIFPYTDGVLDDLARRYTTEMIVEIVNYENLFTSFFIQNCLSQRYEVTIRREKCLDVVMSDIIFSEFRSRQLFYARNHPTNEIIMLTAKRILKQMDIDDEFDKKRIATIKPLSQWQELIYPSTRINMQLQFDKTMYSDGLTSEEKYTFDDEVKRYILFGHYGMVCS